MKFKYQEKNLITFAAYNIHMGKKSGTLGNWLLFAGLSIIWGSSFHLMKIGLESFSAYQVAALRMSSAAIVLLPFFIRSLRAIPKQKYGLVIWSGMLGNFFPSFLFCLAETRIDGALAGILNALTPLFTLLVGVVFFQATVSGWKWLGVLIGFLGLCLLFLSKGIPDLSYVSYASLVLIATICYGLNVNLVSRHLQGIDSLHIASAALGFLLVPSLLVLGATGFFSISFQQSSQWYSLGASSILGIFGTAIASILFYMLVKRAGIVFAAMVTYGIPFVALIWGVWAGEQVGWVQVGCLGIILLGVYITSKSK